MSFEAVWGFDPDRVLNAHSFGRQESVREFSEDKCEMDEGVEKARIPPSVEAQLYELRRMFRS